MHKIYHENGSLRCCYHINDNGYIHGKKEIWTDNGNILSIMSYDNGFIDGKCTHHYYRNDEFGEQKIEAELNYKHNKIHGLVKRYSKDGHVYVSSYYFHHKLHGPVKKYYPNSVCLKSKEFYIMGRREGVMVTYNKNGFPLKFSMMKNDVCDGITLEYQYIRGHVKIKKINFVDGLKKPGPTYKLIDARKIKYEIDQIEILYTRLSLNSTYLSYYT